MESPKNFEKDLDYQTIPSIEKHKTSQLWALMEPGLKEHSEERKEKRRSAIM